MREHIWPRVHVVLDLHSGGDVARFALCASFHPLDDPDAGKKIEETARWFGTPLLMVYQNQTPGLLPSEAERLGKITVGTELGWGRAVNAEGVRYGRQGVLRRRHPPRPAPRHDRADRPPHGRHAAQGSRWSTATASPSPRSPAITSR